MIDVKYAKNVQKMVKKYHKTDAEFEDMLTEAINLNEEAFEKTMKEAEKYNEFNFFIKECQKPFRHLDIVDIAKAIRKEFKHEFGSKMKVSIRTERNWTYDKLYVTIKQISDEYLTPLAEYASEYKKDYKLQYGVEHPYTNDEVFLKYCVNFTDRIKESVYEKIIDIINLFKWDDSNMMIDYFDMNYIADLKMELD